MKSALLKKISKENRGDIEVGTVLCVFLVAVALSSVIGLMGWVKSVKLERMGYVEEVAEE